MAAGWVAEPALGYSSDQAPDAPGGTVPIEVQKIPFEKVADTEGLESAIADGAFAADDIVALIGKTEGNGGVNDFSRILSDRVGGIRLGRDANGKHDYGGGCPAMSLVPTWLQIHTRLFCTGTSCKLPGTRQDQFRHLGLDFAFTSPAQ